MPVDPTLPLITGPWSLVGTSTDPDTQYYRDRTLVDVEQQAVAGEFQISTMCIGPDGMPWTAHIEIENLTTGGAQARCHGIFVHRFDGTNWIQVAYNGPAYNSFNGSTYPYDTGTDDGAVSVFDGGNLLSAYFVHGGEATSLVSNGVSQSPHICTDGTNVYVLVVFNVTVYSGLNPGGPSGIIHVFKWDGSTWTVMSVNATPTADVALAASSADVGHPFIYYRTSTTLAYVDRWNGSAWVHIGGSALPLSLFETTIVTNNNWLRLDNAGNPHALNCRLGTNTSSTPGRTLFMHSWNGSSWSSIDWNSISMGIDSDYRSGGLEQIGEPTTSPLVSSYGTLGKFQVAISLRRYTKTSLHEHLDQPAGFGAYVMEYDCDARAWITLNGAAKYGHVYTYTADKSAGVKAIPLLAQNGPWGLAEPQVGVGANTCWLAEGSLNPVIMVFDGKWRTVSSWYPNLASQSYTTDFKIQTDSVANLSDNAQSSAWIVRDDLELYLPVRWWNGKKGNYQRWNNELDGSNGTGIHANDADEFGYIAAAKNIFRITSSYNAVSSPTTGGTFWAQSSMFSNDQDKNIPTSFRVRIKVNGSGNGDVGLFIAGVFQSYARTSSTTWVELEIGSGITIPSSPSKQIGIRFGVNGGATSIDIDWLEHYPTNASDTTEMRTYLYKGDINPGFVYTVMSLMNLQREKQN